MGFVTPPPAAVESKRPRDAVSPIGSFPNSDVILRSSDQVSFRAHKAVLSVASPFFADMFSLPQPSPSTASSSSSSSSPTIPSTTASAEPDLPVIEMAETEEELALMLSYCYPVEEPTISDFKILTRALAVARKFDMDGMRSRLKRQLMSFVPRFPERAFAVAWAYEMRDVARAAARESLRTPLATMQYVEEFELVSGGALFALLKYQRRCVDAVMALKYQTHRWLADEEIPVSAPMSPTPNRTRTCTCATVQIYIKSSDDGGQIPLQVKEWWHSYIPRACEELARNPLGSTLQKTSLLLPSLIKAHECHACRYSDYEDAMQSLAARLQSEVALAISTIEL